MSNLKIVFESEWHPWLFFTLVPLAAVALWFYFRVPKKYRRTRTRVTSLVLHLIVAVLCVSVLTGLTFTYEIPNEENEILILVDVSFSNSNTKAKHEMTADEFNSSVEGRKNKFIQDILAANGDSVFKVGIIAFARESHYVTGRVSSDAAWVSAKYEEFLSDPPEMDTSATNIGKALAFAKGKFEYEHSGKKVIVITDGVETDGSAIVAISALVAEDIKVDIVCFDEEIDGEVQISNIIMPNYGVAAGTAFLLSVQIDSTVEGTVSLTLYDNDVDCGSVDVDLVFGNQVIPMEHTFLGSGQHQLYIKVTSEVDTIKQNNHYYRYILLNVYDKILIIDKYNESKELLTLLNNEGSLSVVQAVDIHDAPTNLRTLSQYDQIILVNISNEDMTLLAPSGFIEMLHTYVHDFGGGLLTVGGNKYGLSEANAYGRLDMNPDGIPSLYQEMLPVQCIDYYPPLALVIVIDRSGSMSEIDMRSSKSRMELAKDAAKAAVAALSDRDYVGIISFSYTASVNIALTAATRKTDIERAINAIQPVGGTEYANALNLAGQALIGFTLAETK
ncbi:MAG: VWA domain-containing protein, partial [Firmicutes bacterium]|nr:VWA domain-containing protein [Bacillota bacterium]